MIKFFLKTLIIGRGNQRKCFILKASKLFYLLPSIEGTYSPEHMYKALVADISVRRREEKKKGDYALAPTRSSVISP
ncbi:MAG: hypothetical protein GWN31_06990 [Candidatus Thorarchaeota archaeon]|nr:hypothetical protein [Candidatus Thorarchaeota archaeon]NIW13666.1 hypothetical protein [Candidatus Thorarchaeota archaeon]NIW51765.1 hypothetical protein [Candidatus Korarchaeota archaeon]